MNLQGPRWHDVSIQLESRFSATAVRLAFYCFLKLGLYGVMRLKAAEERFLLQPTERVKRDGLQLALARGGVFEAGRTAACVHAAADVLRVPIYVSCSVPELKVTAAIADGHLSLYWACRNFNHLNRNRIEMLHPVSLRALVQCSVLEINHSAIEYVACSFVS